MAANTNPIFPVAPSIGIATLTSPTPITTRTNITGTTGLTQLTPTSTNGKRIDRIAIQSKETSVAGAVWVWLYNGTTSHLLDEILVSAVTGSATVEGFSTYVDYANLVLPPTYQIYVSASVDQDLNVFAHGGDY